MDIEIRNPVSLVPHGKLKFPTDPAYIALRASVRKDGVRVPITLSKSGRKVVDGTRRILAAIEVGCDKVACVRSSL